MNDQIEKAIPVFTLKLLAKLGLSAKKFAGFVGRKLQSFKGQDGFWITSKGRRFFIGIRDAAASKIKGAARSGKRPSIKDRMTNVGVRVSEEAQRTRAKIRAGEIIVGTEAKIRIARGKRRLRRLGLIKASALGDFIREQSKEGNRMKEITLEDFIRSRAPEGTSNEVIEKAASTVTQAMLRGLGKIGEKLKGIVGRVIQHFRGDPGVWITTGGKKVFIPIKDPKAAAAAVKGKPKTLLERQTAAESAARRLRAKELRAIKEDPIGAAIKRDKAAVKRFKASVRKEFRQNRRRTSAINTKLVNAGLIDEGPSGAAFAQNVVDLAEDAITSLITGGARARIRVFRGT